MITMKDVAAKADVNPSTVSCVLKDNKSIPRRTRDKVRKAMTEFGYMSDIAVRMLASGLTYNVSLIFSSLMAPDRLDESFFMQILSTTTGGTKLDDFTVSIATGMTVDEPEEQAKLMHRQKCVDGFIILYFDPDDPVCKYLMNNDVPLVVVGVPEGFENDITYIDDNNQLTGKKAVEYLYQKRRREVLLVIDDLKSEVLLERYFDYLRDIEKLELDSNPAPLLDRRGPMVLEELIQKIEESRAIALTVTIDTISARIVQFLFCYQLDIPDDISIITLNNSMYSTLAHPYLTIFDINVPSLGRTGFRRLVELAKPSRTVITEEIVVPSTPGRRESIRQLHVND